MAEALTRCGVSQSFLTSQHHSILCRHDPAKESRIPRKRRGSARYHSSFSTYTPPRSDDGSSRITRPISVWCSARTANTGLIKVIQMSLTNRTVVSSTTQLPSSIFTQRLCASSARACCEAKKKKVKRQTATRTHLPTSTSRGTSLHAPAWRASGEGFP